ncbi:GNAT family N-acetyltransferase [Amycolatopsis sp. NPDC049252]|uniref:GNAT family N-acetyltransferase n=1 Tax=Amycolatopsis sp. NPDC049252 TaxID=3363933 RepID=UPI0037211884
MNHSGTAVVTRVAERHWHALEDDLVVGRGEASRRPDGRTFLSIDAWHGAVFDHLAEAMLRDLPRPLHTVVDEADLDLTTDWLRAGFSIRRREWEYVVPTRAGETPPDVTVIPVGEAEEKPLKELDRVIRAEVERTVGWQEMPAEVRSVLDPSRYAVAARGGDYAGLVRVVPLRQPRIGLIAVRAELRRRGIARALLAHVLDSLYHKGIETASAEVNEANAAATALFESFGARRAGSNLELVIR